MSAKFNSILDTYVGAAKGLVMGDYIMLVSSVKCSYYWR